MPHKIKASEHKSALHEPVAPFDYSQDKAVAHRLSDVGLALFATHHAECFLRLCKVTRHYHEKGIHSDRGALFLCGTAAPGCAVMGKMTARKYVYRRNLPHIQKEAWPHFVTFVTYRRWELPPIARDLVLTHCLHDNGTRARVHAVVVMPDHVHMILTPLWSLNGDPFTFEEILGGIKGASAHSVNQLLSRRGKLWLDESFDHVLWSAENMNAKCDYICDNPVRKGLVARREDYRWLWIDPVCTAEGGCATPE